MLFAFKLKINKKNICQENIPGGRVLLFLHIHRLVPVWGLMLFILHKKNRVVRKINNLIIWGMKKLLVFLGAITKLNYLWGSYLNILGLFHKVKVQNWNIFWGC